MEGYGERWHILLRLGFGSYADYLQSDLWQDIRKRVFALQPDRRCDHCKKERAVQVHHRTYDEKTLRGLRLDRLVPLCRKCHEQIEFDAMGRKRTLAEANAQLDRWHDLKALAKLPRAPKKPKKGKKKAPPKPERVFVPMTDHKQRESELGRLRQIDARREATERERLSASPRRRASSPSPPGSTERKRGRLGGRRRKGIWA